MNSEGTQPCIYGTHSPPNLPPIHRISIFFLIHFDTLHNFLFFVNIFRLIFYFFDHRKHDLLSIYTYIFSPWPCHTACRILVPQLGIEPGPSAVKVQSPNHWTARKIPYGLHLIMLIVKPQLFLLCPMFLWFSLMKPYFLGGSAL